MCFSYKQLPMQETTYVKYSVLACTIIIQVQYDVQCTCTYGETSNIKSLVGL